MQALQPSKKSFLLLPLFLLPSLCLSQVTEQWVKRYNGPASINDNARSLAIDVFGNVYVTGQSIGSGTSYDYATVKYDASGNELWVKWYDGPGSNSDYASSLALDAYGNVYVTGSSEGIGGVPDYATIKYDASGNEVWVRRYNGPANSYDGAVDIAIDVLGNVCVTGQSHGSETGFDYATVKYDTDGNQLWVKRYSGSGEEFDGARSLAVDASGNVYVTGQSNESLFNSDYATIKYDSAGNELWVRRYSGYASSLTLDASGNVYVTGTSSIGYATIKYDTDGNELWVRGYTGDMNGYNNAASLMVDTSGNVYVTGSSTGSGTGRDYATVKYDNNGNQLWVKQYNGVGNGDDLASSVVVDASGNVYVSGNSPDSGGSSDYATIKYAAAGNEVWVQRYNGLGNGNDDATAVAVDNTGNVYVTGYSDGGETAQDYATIKYSQVQATVVSSFTLINADTDKDIRELKDGDTINLEALSSVNLNIRANTDPATVGSVVFKLSDAESRTHTENTAPYALFANSKEDYNAWIPKVGNYTLTATPYSGAKGSGTKGTPMTIHFHVTGRVVSSLILVNSETDQDIRTLKNGDVIDLATLPTEKLNIRAVVHPDTVGSVVFNLNNKVLVRENLVPYAIGGDIKGNFRAWTLPTGKHLLTATPYSGKYGRGTKGRAHSVSFTVVDRATITIRTRTEIGQEGLIAEVKGAGRSLRAGPNPFTTQTTISFSVPESGYTTVQVYNVNGIVVARLYQAQTEAGKGYTVQFDSKQLPAGVYIVKLTTGKLVQSTKLVLVH